MRNRTALAILVLAATAVAQAQLPPPRTDSVAWRRHDADRDGRIARDEFRGPPALFRNIDKDRDGFIVPAEVSQVPWPMALRAFPPLPEGVEIRTDIAYVADGSEAQRLDLLLPPERGTRPGPCIVYIHGGGWRAGDKATGYTALGPLLERGYVGVTINYRLTREAIFPAQIHDCKAAIRYLRAHADELGIDREAIGVWGASAGGHLAALLGTSGGVAGLEGELGWGDESSRVQAVCDFFGPTDLPKVEVHKPASMEHVQGLLRGLLGGSVDEKPELARLASPVTHISPDDPPFLIYQGELDRLVPAAQSREFHAALEATGVESQLIVFDDAGHGGAPFVSDETREHIAAFFDRHLKRAGDSGGSQSTDPRP